MARPPKSLLKDSHPDIASQLVDRSLLPSLATGSNSKVEWECEHGHRWFAKVFNRTNSKSGTGCPVCSGRIVVQGYNDVATTRPELVRYFVDKSIAQNITAYSSKVVRVRCDKGHERNMPMRNFAIQGISCPYCSGRYAMPGETDLATLLPDLAAELVDKSLATKLRPGSNSLVEWRCGKCGYVWKASAFDRSGKGNGCPRCSGRVIVAGENDLATVAPEYAATLVSPELAKTFGKSSDVSLEWICQRDSSHRWYSSPGNRLRASLMAGCPICNNKAVVAGVNDLVTTHPSLAAELVDTSLGRTLTAGSGTVVEWECRTCGHRWSAPVYCRGGGNHCGCPVCNTRGTSIVERELAACVKALLPDETVDLNVHDLLDGKQELDIVVRSKQIAFEFNGMRWHTEEMGKSRSYHHDKTIACRKLGYQLIHIWEDDWKRRRNVVIRMVAAKLGVTASVHTVFPEIDEHCSERLFARKLRFCEVSGKAAGEFLENNHIQGKVTATRHFALVDNDDILRAVMSIRSPRNNARMHRVEGEWEIQRYATCGTIVGGFTKLMRNAEKVLLSEGVCLTRWVSFSSNDVSDGSMYAKCGFVADREIAPDYKYVGEKIGWHRHPKERFQRRRFRDDPDLVWNESWTEAKAASENGLYRIWDAGKIRWVLDVTKNDIADAVSVDMIDAVMITNNSHIAFVEPVNPPKRRGGYVRTGEKPGPKVADLRGHRFGRWTVLERADDKVNSKTGRHFPMWLCECDCGTRRAVLGSSLRNGRSLSCGCIKAASHKSDIAASYLSCDSDGNPVFSGLVEYFGEMDVETVTVADIEVAHVISRDLYVCGLTGEAHGWHWLGEVAGEKVPCSCTSLMRQDAVFRKEMCSMNANLVVFWDEQLWDMDLWFAMGAPSAKDWERSYSWLHARELHAGLMPVDWRRLKTFSKVVKYYQHDTIYAAELAFWSDDRFLDKIRDKRRMVGAFFANRYYYINKLPNELSDAEILRGLRIAGMVRAYTTYNTNAMSAFLESHTDVNSVIDPCAGWGERALCCAKYEVSYAGVDINEALRPGYDAMISELGLSFVSVDFEDAAKHVFGQADAVVTCPPYMGVEHYSDAGAENLFEVAFASWWTNVVNAVVASGCKYFCITTNQACKKVFSDAIVRAGFELTDSVEVNKRRASHFNRRGGANTKREFEEFLVFERV